MTGSRAVRTKIPWVLFARMRTRWLLETDDAADKLELLRRVVRRDLEGVLPRLIESRVEQSWNEQIFARVLGYQTLFSHDSLPYHLEPKRYGNGLYDDFSLGLFGGGPERVVASAELKSPHADLDRPQPGYGNISAVEQALRRAEPEGVPWALVSNFVELRLYRVCSSELIAIARIDRIRSRVDIQALGAVFSRRSLLGDAMTKADLDALLEEDADHPAAPLPGNEHCMRVVLRAQSPGDEETPLHQLEARLAPLMNDTDWQRCAGTYTPVSLRDGWLVLEGTSRKNDMSSRCTVAPTNELILSVCLPPARVDGSRQLEPGWVCAVGRLFLTVLHHVDPHASPGTIIEVDVLDAKDSKLYSGRLGSESCPGGGDSVAEYVTSGPFRTEGSPMAALVGAICEVAVQYRHESGGVLLDPAKVRAKLARSDSE